MNRLSLVPLAALALSFGAGCAQAECASNFDCGIGNSCSADGSCMTGGSGVRSVGEPGGGGGGGGMNNDYVDVGLIDSGWAPGEATFDGNIGPSLTTGRADLSWSVYESGAAELTVSIPEAPAAFVYLYVVDATVLQTPGQLVIGAPDANGLTDSWGQGCNYSDNSPGYDEQLSDVVVEVSELDTDGMIFLTITIDGEGTDGAALVPWTPPALF
ncbi:MAG: hypothetical protein Q8O67_17740 [Deltaproteobacteria bacterium]|nr:hypothetical protein [Deltaproteobacteria bacterium]